MARYRGVKSFQGGFPRGVYLVPKTKKWHFEGEGGLPGQKCIATKLIGTPQNGGPDGVKTSFWRHLVAKNANLLTELHRQKHQGCDHFALPSGGNWKTPRANWIPSEARQYPVAWRPSFSLFYPGNAGYFLLVGVKKVEKSRSRLSANFGQSDLLVDSKSTQDKYSVTLINAIAGEPRKIAIIRYFLYLGFSLLVYYTLLTTQQMLKLYFCYLINVVS